MYFVYSEYSYFSVRYSGILLVLRSFSGMITLDTACTRSILGFDTLKYCCTLSIFGCITLEYSLYLKYSGILYCSYFRYSEYLSISYGTTKTSILGVFQGFTLPRYSGLEYYSEYLLVCESPHFGDRRFVLSHHRCCMQASSFRCCMQSSCLCLRQGLRAETHHHRHGPRTTRCRERRSSSSLYGR